MSKKKKKDTVIYIGPTVKEVNQFDVFTNGFPDSVKKHLENPVFEKLFISTSELPLAKSNLETPGTKENQLFLKALEIIKRGDQ